MSCLLPKEHGSFCSFGSRQQMAVDGFKLVISTQLGELFCCVTCELSILKDFLSYLVLNPRVIQHAINFLLTFISIN